jgi:beta-lactamase regulating signal transducer with metallopeptidase domain
VEFQLSNFERYLWSPSLDTAAKSLLILFVAALLTIALKRSSAALRHFFWFLAMASLLALPGLTKFLPSLPIPIPQTALSEYLETKSRGSRSENPPVQVVPRTDSRAPSAAFPAHSMPPSQERATEQVGKVASERSGQLFNWMAWTGPVWLAGVLVVFVPLLVGTVILRRISAIAEPITNKVITALFHNACQDLGIQGEVQLLSSTSITMPVTWGFRRHVILLPDQYHDWAAERQRLVLLHELAHVKRMDCLTQFIAWSVCSLFWFNPLAWLAVRRMRIERERACDDLVTNQGVEAANYATHLLEIAQAGYGMTPTSIAAVAMARPTELEGRLLTILDAKRNRNHLTRADGIFSLTTIICTLCLIAACKTTQTDARASSNRARNSYRLDKAQFDSIASLSKISAISGESGFSMSLSNGIVWSWGFNGNGRLGDGSTINRSTPVRVDGLTDVVQIAGGGTFGAALMEDSTVWCWGANDVGQLGDGNYRDSPIPVHVLYHPDYETAYSEWYNAGYLSNVVEIAAGSRHCLALRAGGDFMSWGYNGIYHNSYARVPHGHDPVDIIHISAGDSHDLLLSSTGIVYAWGENNYGQVGNNSQVDIYAPGVAVLSSIVAIATGRHHSVALDNQGNVWVWGLNDHGQLGATSDMICKAPLRSGLTNVVAIAAGNGYTMALLSDNTVIEMGKTDVWDDWNQRLTAR